MTREALAQAISDATPQRPPPPPPAPEACIAAVAALFRVPAEEILGRSRAEPIATARHVAMALIYADAWVSLPDIASEFDRDHSTVSWAIRKVTASPELSAYAAAARADMKGDASG